MKASELRIGNLILEDGDVQHVTPNTIRIIYESEVFNIKKPMFFYEPIPLTEEWLEKFGFVEDLSQLDPPDTPNGNFWSEYEKNGVRIDMPFYEYNEDEISVEIKHVHQLQNLYFALTAEELTLNK